MPFVSDTFTGTAGTALASHTGEVGATWTVHPSYANDAVLTDANRVRVNGTNVGYYASGVPATAEYDVSAVFRAIDSSVTTGIGTTGRMATAADTMYLLRPSAGVWQLFKAVSGAFTLLGSYSQALTVGVDYTVKLEIRDAAKKVYIDGVERISSADNAITGAGRAGLRGGNAATNTTGVHLDDFTATDAGGGGGGSLSLTSTVAIQSLVTSLCTRRLALTETAAGQSTLVSAATRTLGLQSTHAGQSAITSAGTRYLALSLSADGQSLLVSAGDVTAPGQLALSSFISGQSAIASAGTRSLALSSTVLGQSAVASSATRILTLVTTASGQTLVSSDGVVWKVLSQSISASSLVVSAATRQLALSGSITPVVLITSSATATGETVTTVDGLTSRRDIAFTIRGEEMTYHRHTGFTTDYAAMTKTPAFSDTTIAETLPAMISDEDVAMSNGRYQVGDWRVRVRHSDLPATPPSQYDRVTFGGSVYQIYRHQQSNDRYVWDLYVRAV